MRFTKLQAANQLVDSALSALLDRGDAFSAIVLAGSAEDIFIGLLYRSGKPIANAREEMIPHIRAFIAVNDPLETPITDKSGHSIIRRTFNWLRHNDKADEPQERETDFDLEAAAIIERALETSFRLTGIDHPRLQELVIRWRNK